MATVIDSLSVELGIDASRLISQLRAVDEHLDEFIKRSEQAGDALGEVGEEGKGATEKLAQTGEVGESSGSRIQGAFSKVAEGLRKVRSVAGEVIATIGGAWGIQRLIGGALEYGNAVQLMSKKFGVSAESITAWGRAAELAGGTADGMQRSLEALSRAHTEMALTGTTSMLPYLSMLGVSVSDANGRMRDFDAILLDLADRFSKMDSRHAYNVGSMMGLDESTINLLIRGRVEVEQMLKRQKEFGAVSKEEAERGRRVNEVMTKGKQTMEALGRSIASSLMPFVELLVSAFEDLNRWVIKNEGAVKVFIIALTALAAAIVPVNMAAVAVTALAGAIALLWDDYKTWKEGGDSLIDWNKWKPGIDAAVFGIRWLRDLLEDLMFRCFVVRDIFAALWDGDWDKLDRSWKLFKEGTGKKYGGVPKEWERAGQAQNWSDIHPGYIGEGQKVQTGGAIDAIETTGITGNSKRDKAVRYFMSQGWTKEQAIGIAANIHHESGFKEHVQGDKDPRTGQYKAYGIAQWHPDRQREFKRVFEKDIRESTYEEQLAFIHHELTTTHKSAGDALRKSKTAGDAAAALTLKYEIPANKEQKAIERAATANKYAREYASSVTDYAKSSAPGTTQTSNTTNNTNTVTANIGEIKVNTAATDARGIAQDIGNELNNTLTAQSNMGVF